MNDDFRPRQRRADKPVQRDRQARSSSSAQSLSENDTKSPKTSKKKRQLLLAAPRKVHWWLKNMSRKQLIIVGLVLLALLGAGYWWLNNKSKEEPTAENSSVKSEPKPTTVASRMTGVQVAPELNELPVSAVMIENSPDARPQSGLLNADMVFEAIAEGGITRFLALYQESKPDYIGPVRSVRPYYLDYAVSFDAAIVHAGGSTEAKDQISSQRIKDIDHGANGSTFQRVSNRYAPHNLYTSRDKLLEAHNKRGYTSSSYKTFERKADAAAATVTARTIDLNISSFLYNPHYDYDATSNSYKRSIGGKPHTDERSGSQITPKVVVALVVSRSQNGVYSVYQTHGSGVAYVFQDGIVQQVTWSKSDRKGELMLKDAAGAPVKLNAGQTWLSLVADTGRVTYAP